MIIKEIIQSESQVMLLRLIDVLAPQYLFNLFVENSTNPSYSLRGTATHLKLPKRNSSTTQKGFSYRDARIWDSLPGQ